MLKRFLTLGAILSGFIMFLFVPTSCATSGDANTILIPKDQMVFSPFILVVQPNTTVTWQNESSATHTIQTTLEKSNFVNPDSFLTHVLGGESTQITFTKPGLYHYYEAQESTWNNTDRRVAANKGSLAAEGIIWVQGNISGLPSSATNIIPAGKDLFNDNFIAIAQGGTVEWHNLDTDQHAIALVAGWSAPINPANIGTLIIRGTQSAPPHGGIQRVTFNTPGLYYYYCPIHAYVNTAWKRAISHINASENPIPMEGFVLVNGS